MTRTIRLLLQSLAMCLASLFVTFPVLAIPGLPSSFYGEVKVNDAYVSDGTVIRALIGDQVFAEGYTLSYQGASVYTLDIPGDDLDTATLDGGHEGDVIKFEIGGVLADQTGTWHSGTNVSLDLSVITTDQLSEPQATPSPVPTQTPISNPQSANTRSVSEGALTAATVFVQPVQTETEAMQSLPVVNTSAPSLQKPIEHKDSLATFTPSVPLSSISNPPVDSAPGNLLTPTLTIVVIALVIVLVSVAWFVRNRIHIARKPNSSKQYKAQGGS